MSDREQAVALLHLAARDLRALKGMLDPDVFADEVFGFIAQQTVEKSLKSWLCLLSQPYPFTHDLTELIARLADSGQNVDELWELVELNPFAVALRYADLSTDEAPLDRGDAIKRVEALYERVRKAVHGEK